jgi:hypothetical protein
MPDQAGGAPEVSKAAVCCIAGLVAAFEVLVPTGLLLSALMPALLPEAQGMLTAEEIQLLRVAVKPLLLVAPFSLLALLCGVSLVIVAACVLCCAHTLAPWSSVLYDHSS